MSLVLWGARRGDVQYASGAFWRRNLRVGVPTITVDSPYFADVGTEFEISRTGEIFVVDSMEGRTLAVLR